MAEAVVKSEFGTITRRTLGQLARYGVAGIAVNLVLYVFYLLLTWMEVGPLVAATIVFLVGVPVSLMAHGRFTFRSDDISIFRKALFAGGYFVGYLTQIGTLAFLHFQLGIAHQLSQFIAMIVVAAVLFVFQKLLVFRA